MGRRLDHFEFALSTPNRRSPYPLDEWMDGSIWAIVRGEDFEGPLKHMQARLRHYASTRGYWVQTPCLYSPDRESVVFRYTAKQKLRAWPA